MAQTNDIAAGLVGRFGTRERESSSGTLCSSLTYCSLSLSVLYTQYAGPQATACSISDTRVDLLGFAIGQVSFRRARRLLFLESSKCYVYHSAQPFRHMVYNLSLREAEVASKQYEHLSSEFLDLI